MSIMGVKASEHVAGSNKISPAHSRRIRCKFFIVHPPDVQVAELG